MVYKSKYTKPKFFVCISALPTTIRLPSGQGQSVLWGLAEKSQQHETIMVGHALKHFRAVDVSVVGVRITEETPYRATLSAIFPDGSRRQRRIDGVVQRIYLDNIRPEYSRVYHIKEASAASPKPPRHTPELPMTSTLKPLSAGSHLPKRPEADKAKDFHYKDTTNGLRDTNRQTAKDRVLSEQQLLMASSSATAAAVATASVNFLSCLSLLPLVSSLLLLLQPNR